MADSCHGKLTAGAAFNVGKFFVNRAIHKIVIFGAVGFQFFILWFIEFWVQFAPDSGNVGASICQYITSKLQVLIIVY